MERLSDIINQVNVLTLYREYKAASNVKKYFNAKDN